MKRNGFQGRGIVGWLIFQRNKCIYFPDCCAGTEIFIFKYLNIEIDTPAWLKNELAYFYPPDEFSVKISVWGSILVLR